MPSKLKAGKELLETGLGSFSMKQMRSFGTNKRINPNQVKIGSTKSGLYYDKDLPFVKSKQKKSSSKHTGERGGKGTHTRYYIRKEENPLIFLVLQDGTLKIKREL